MKTSNYWRTAAAASLSAALILASATTAVAAPPPSVSLRASVVDVAVGGSSTLSGYVSAGGRAVVGAAVEIWVRPVGSAAWHHTANATTTSAGGYALPQSYSQASVTLARLAGPVRVDSAQLVTRSHQSFAAVGIKGCAYLPDDAWLEWQGRTSPTASGSLAIAQFRFGDGYPWQTAGITHVAADGTFSSRYTTGHGPFDARWVLNGRTNVVGAASPTYTGVGPIGNFSDVPECDQFTRTP